MDFLTWEKNEKEIVKIFLQLKEKKGLIYLWQSWGLEAHERAIRLCLIKNVEKESKRMSFHFLKEEKRNNDSHYFQLSEEDEVYCFAPEYDLIFKSKILAISEEMSEVLIDKSNKIISLSSDCNEKEKEKTQEEKLLEKHIKMMVSEIEDGFKKRGFRENSLEESAKSYAFSPKDSLNLSKGMEKLENLIDGEELKRALFDNVKNVSLMIKGYGPLEFELKSFQDLKLVLETDLKDLFHLGDDIEILSFDHISLKETLKGMVKQVDYKMASTFGRSRKEFQVMIQLNV